MLIAAAESQELRKEGYAVLIASSGEKAVEIVGTSAAPIDLILMDVDLGRGMDGTQAAEEILKIRELPVLFLSGHTEKDIVAKTEKITSYGYVVKNTGMTVLNASIKMAFKLFDAHRDIRTKDSRLQDTTTRLLRGEAIANTGNWEFHIDTGMVSLSDGAKKICGLRVEDERLADLSKLIPSEFMPKVENAFKRLIENGEAYDIEHKILQLGSGAVLDLHSVAEYDRQNRIVFGVMQDVTAQREAEAKIDRERRLLLAIIDNFPDEFFMKDRDGRYVYVNKEKCRRLGADKPEDVIGRSSGEFFPAGRADEFWSEQREMMLSKTIKKTTEAGLVSRDGSIRWVQHTTVPLLDQKGEPYGIIRISKDITDFELARAELERERRLLLTIVNNIPYFIYLKDSQGRYLFANDRKVKALGVASLEDVLGKTVYDFFPAPTADRIVAMGKEIIGSGTSFRDREEKKVVDGKVEWRLGTDIPLYDENGNSAGLLSIAKDITAQKRMEETLRETIFQKETLMKELQHRVKNNLNLISSLLNLEAANVTDQKALQVLGDARGRIHSMSALYEGLYLSEDLSNVELKEYIKNLTESLLKTYSLPEKKIWMTARLADVKLDSKRTVPLGLILNELITNALKYAFPRDREGEIKVILEKTGEGLELLVADDGIGWPPDFDPAASGSMGLTLVRVLAAQIDGEVSFDRTVKKGTSVRLKVEIK